MADVFIKSERDDEAAVREAVKTLDATRLNELADFAAWLLTEQEEGQ